MIKEQKDSKLIYVESVDSTNRLTRRMLKEEKIIDETVIMAGFQTNGRGQAGNYWESIENKNILASVIWHPGSIKPGQQFYISMAVSLSICDLLEHYKLLPKIKWPNDILANNKKIAGILIELFISGNDISNVISGIGINVNQTSFFKYEPQATSVLLESGKDNDIKEMVIKLSEFMSVRYSELQNSEFSNLKNSYLLKLFRYQEWAKYNDGSKDLEAMIIDVNELGELIMQNRKGEQFSFAFKEVSFIDI